MPLFYGIFSVAFFRLSCVGIFPPVYCMQRRYTGILRYVKRSMYRRTDRNERIFLHKKENDNSY